MTNVHQIEQLQKLRAYLQGLADRAGMLAKVIQQEELAKDAVANSNVVEIRDMYAKDFAESFGNCFELMSSMLPTISITEKDA